MSYVIRTHESPPRYLVTDPQGRFPVRWSEDVEEARVFKRRGRATGLLPGDGYGEVVTLEEARKTFVVPAYWAGQQVPGFTVGD